MGNCTRVLVVDDEPADASLMKDVLEHGGHRVVASTSPKQALDLVADDDFDVVVTDVAMAELDGLVFCERVLAARPETPIVVVTGHGKLEVALRAMRAGAYDFITKPIEVDALQGAVARAARKREVRIEVTRSQRAIEPSPRANEFGASAAMRRVAELVGRIATSDASVLIQGETGTGKELVARALHEASGATGAFVALNCAAVPSQLLESELFGHARGAYTDASSHRSGLFVEAEHGTIFLDEIGDLPRELQPKLLRVLQERRVRPLGSNAEVAFDGRVVVATHRDLEEEVRAGRFREDLYYRINVITVDLPPLRERGHDVVDLATQFLLAIAARTGGASLVLSSTAAAKLLAYPWPGNVRELENCIERAAVLARHREITVGDLPRNVRDHRAEHVIVDDDSTDLVTLAELERRYIVRVVTLFDGNKARAAKVLGLDRKTLYRKLERWGVTAPSGATRKRRLPS